MANRVGPYEIAGQIGRGGMAVVYLARQRALGRMVALKELAPFDVRDELLARRFLREAQVAGSLNHPNIVTVSVGGQPRDIATDGASLWVTDRTGDRVVRIDAGTSKVVDRAKVDGGPLGVAVGEDAVWVSDFDGGQVTRLGL